MKKKNASPEGNNIQLILLSLEKKYWDSSSFFHSKYCKCRCLQDQTFSVVINTGVNLRSPVSNIGSQREKRYKRVEREVAVVS